MVDFAKNCGCCGVAAAVAVGAFNPFDTLRVRWQLAPTAGAGAAAVAPDGNSMLAFTRRIMATEGLWTGLWRPGCSAAMLSMGVSAGTRMGVYPYLRDWACRGGRKTPAVMFGTGLLAGGVGYFISTPLFQAKTRAQTAPLLTPGGGGAAAPTSTLGHVLAVWSEGGLRASLRGACPLVVRGALFSAGQTLGYDGTKTELAQRSAVMRDGPALHMLASVCAAFCATTFSAPADYVMTRYQASFQMGGGWASPGECLRDLLRAEGAGVLYRGWAPFFAKIVPVFLTFHPLMEQCRRLVGLGYMH